MPDQDWQQAVLRDLGASGSGLATLEPARPASAPQPAAAPVPPAPPQPVQPVQPTSGPQPGAAERPVWPAPSPSTAGAGATPPVTGPMGVPPQPRRSNTGEHDLGSAVRPETVMFSLPPRQASSSGDGPAASADPAAAARPETAVFSPPNRTTDPGTGTGTGGGTGAGAGAEGTGATGTGIGGGTTGDSTGGWYAEPPSSFGQPQTGPGTGPMPMQPPAPQQPQQPQQQGRPPAPQMPMPQVPQQQPPAPQMPMPQQPPAPQMPMPQGPQQPTSGPQPMPPTPPAPPAPPGPPAPQMPQQQGRPPAPQMPMPQPPQPPMPQQPPPGSTPQPFDVDDIQLPPLQREPDGPEPAEPPRPPQQPQQQQGPQGQGLQQGFVPQQQAQQPPQQQAPSGQTNDAIPAYGFTAVFQQMDLQAARAEADALAKAEAQAKAEAEAEQARQQSRLPGAQGHPLQQGYAPPPPQGYGAPQQQPPQQQGLYGPQGGGQMPMPGGHPGHPQQGHPQQGGQPGPGGPGMPGGPSQTDPWGMAVSGPQQQQQQQQGPGAGPAPQADELARKNRHGDPVFKRMGRGVRRVMGASAAQDARLQEEVLAKLRVPVSLCRQIAVTSVRGGAGKTTVTALTASMAASIRQDRVLTIDADTGLGSLPLRLGAQPQLSLHELASARPGSFEEATRYLAQTREGLWLLSGTTGGQLAEELEIEKYYSALGNVARYFSTAMVDCGAGIVNKLQRGILSGAHGQILVTPATVDGAVSAMGAIDWYKANGYEGLLPSTVIVLVTHTPHADSDLNKAIEMLSSGGMPVFHIPYDRHLAGGTAIDLTRISEAARTTATRIAAEVFSRSAGR